MKTLRLLPFLFLLGTAHAGTTVGSGHVVSETRNVGGFHGVGLQGSGRVVLTQADAESLVVEADDNLLPLIETHVDSDGVLHLGFKRNAGDIETKNEVVYKVSAKVIDRLAVHGSGSIRAASVTADGLELRLPGSGEIAVDRLKAASVKVNVEGSGEITLAGESPRLSVTIDGSGQCEAKGLRSDEVEVNINGSGEAKVNARETLKVEVNGSGAVGYGGNPKLTQQVNGSGEVRRLDAKED